MALDDSGDGDFQKGFFCDCGGKKACGFPSKMKLYFDPDAFQIAAPRQMDKRRYKTASSRIKERIVQAIDPKSSRGLRIFSSMILLAQAQNRSCVALANP